MYSLILTSFPIALFSLPQVLHLLTVSSDALPFLNLSLLNVPYISDLVLLLAEHVSKSQLGLTPAISLTLCANQCLQYLLDGSFGSFCTSCQDPGSKNLGQ